ncbi:hypothetical protein GCM10023210_22030 [Chryseobacterium ginsengisoli]|uniref:Uncharacterized protein n=1 Tax=Chryseobacterium ginsengisoli TaxID=363853 RepID=A0ABP9MCW6_9FLAO
MSRMQSKIFLTLMLIMTLMSCKAQNLSLNTAFSTIPNGAYLKDANNELTPYIGTYKANFEENEITLYTTKQ